MTLILSDDEVRDLVSMPDCIEAMATAYADLNSGEGIYRVRTDLIALAKKDDSIFSLKSMDGVVPRFGVGTVRINSDILQYKRAGDKLRRERVPADADGRYVGFVLVSARKPVKC